MAASALRPVFRMAVRNVRRNWRHSLGSVLSVAIGFMAIGLFEGYLRSIMVDQGEGFSRRNMYGQVLVERHGAQSAEAHQEPSRFWMGAKEQAFLDEYLARHADQVEVRVRTLGVSGLISTGKSAVGFIGLGADVKEGAEIRGGWAWNAIAGKPLQAAPPNAVMLGRGLGAAMECVPASDAPYVGKDGLPIPAERPLICKKPRVQLTTTTAGGQLNVVEPEVAGLFNAGLKEIDSRLINAPLPLVQKLLDTDAVSMYSILLKRTEDTPAFVADLRSEAQRAGLDLNPMPWQEHATAELYRRGVGMLAIYRSFVVVIVVAIAGMSVLMTVMKAVSERIREIGSLRSLGFLRRHIVGLFVLESVLLALASAAVGFVATLGATFLLNRSGISYRAGLMAEDILLGVAYVPSAYAFAVGFLSSVAVLAAYLPARRAAYMPIPDALGHA